MKTFFYTGPNKQNVSGMSYKIWKIARVGRRVRTQWGPATIDHATRKVVPKGALQEFVSPSAFQSVAAARADEERRVKEKLSEGYKRAPSRRKRTVTTKSPRRESAIRPGRVPAARQPRKLSRTLAGSRKASSRLARWTPTLAKVRALSLRQPWAWLVVNGYKDIENRSWRTKHRGPLLIHASSTLTDFKIEYLAKIEKNYGYGVKVPETVDVGGIVGVVDVVDCVPRHSSKWYFRGNWAWVLRNPRRVPFRECKAVVGFFTPEFKTR